MVSSEPVVGEAQIKRGEHVANTRRLLSAFFRRARTGLAGRLALYTAILGTIVTAVLTTYMYQGSVDALVAGELRELAATNQAAGLRLGTRIALAREDALILARLPELVAVAEARRNGDAAAGPGGEEDRARLASIFRTMLDGRMGYVELNAAGADGREIVRLDRLPDGDIRTATAAELRSLAGRTYFSDAIRLAADTAYISDVGMNLREGTVETPFRAVVRAAAPIDDAAGRRLGVVVISIDLDRLFGLTTQAGRPQSLHFITNRDGAYLFQPDLTAASGFSPGRLIQRDLPQLAPLFAADGSSVSGTIVMGDRPYVSDARRIYYDLHEPDRYLVLATLWSQAHVGAEIAALRDRTLLVAGVLLIIGVIAVALLAGGVVRPLRALTAATTRIAAGEHEVDVDTIARRGDEVGELARSIEAMDAKIRSREDEIRAGADDLERTNKELNQFAYIASHDLQEPLRMVASYLDLLERRYGDRLDGDAREFIDYAVDGARRMKELINDLLAYSRVSNRPLDIERVDVAAVVANVERTLGERIAECGAEITVAPLPSIEADVLQLERLLTNLVGNAVKYRGEAPLRIAIAAECKDAAWEFSVADNGIGIPPAFREKVFDIFARLHGRERYPGSGIGLASCRRIVERHGGRIWIDSTPGGGATFRFTLPVRMATEEFGNAA